MRIHSERVPAFYISRLSLPRLRLTTNILGARISLIVDYGYTGIHRSCRLILRELSSLMMIKALVRIALSFWSVLVYLASPKIVFDGPES